MRTLAIDCATEACSVGLFEAGKLLAGDFRVLGRGHAEQLVPMIGALPERGRAERILVALGPGSFTGVRVGVAAARALGLAWNVPVLGYATMSLIAAMAREAHGNRPLSAVMTGGHGEWFVQSFGADGEARGAAASMRPEDAVVQIPDELLAGTQAEAFVALRGHGEAISILPDARAAFLLDADALTPDIQPLYGRAPDARLPGGAA
jgi:tRNA threonylcarbamoyladenosine biosynthesis protein TsaB